MINSFLARTITPLSCFIIIESKDRTSSTNVEKSWYIIGVGGGGVPFEADCAGVNDFCWLASDGAPKVLGGFSAEGHTNEPLHYYYVQVRNAEAWASFQDQTAWATVFYYVE